MIDLYLKKVLDDALAVVAGLLLPLSSPEQLDPGHRSVASGTSRALLPCNCGVPRGRDDNGRSSREGCVVHRSRVVCSVGDKAAQCALELTEEIGNGRSVVGVSIGEHLRNDNTRLIDAEMELPPAPFPLSSMLRGRPLAFAHDRESSTVDDKMGAFTRADSTKPQVELLATPRERGVIWRGEVETHDPEERAQEALGLAKRQIEEDPESQSGLDGEVGVPQLSPSLSDIHGLPCGDRLR